MTTYSAPLSGAEEHEFVPFMHELIGIAPGAHVTVYFGTAIS